MAYTTLQGIGATGGCTAPGGNITGMPGRNAAAAILHYAGASIEQVVGKGRNA